MANSSVNWRCEHGQAPASSASNATGPAWSIRVRMNPCKPATRSSCSEAALNWTRPGALWSEGREHESQGGAKKKIQHATSNIERSIPVVPADHLSVECWELPVHGDSQSR